MKRTAYVHFFQLLVWLLFKCNFVWGWHMQRFESAKPVKAVLCIALWRHSVRVRIANVTELYSVSTDNILHVCLDGVVTRNIFFVLLWSIKFFLNFSMRVNYCRLLTQLCCKMGFERKRHAVAGHVLESHVRACKETAWNGAGFTASDLNHQSPRPNPESFQP